MTPLTRSTFELMFLWLGRGDDEARAHALDEGAEHVARQFGFVVRHERAWKACAGIAGLPTTASGFDMTQNHVDLLSGKVHAAPTPSTATATDDAAIIRVLSDSQSWLTQKARRGTSDPVLARPKCRPSWQPRSTCARSPRPVGMQTRSAAPCPGQ